mgnify:CR=1 FL=1
MRRAFPFAVLGVLAFIVLILYLNLRERDFYADGQANQPKGPVNVEPNDGGLPWLPLHEEHDGCVHSAEFTENHSWCRVRDHDGWYRLFWAGDEVYYFEDPSPLHQAMLNPTARDATGEWRIAVTYRPPPTCSRPATTLRFRLALEVGDAAIPPDPPDRTRWFVGKTLKGHRFYDWRLVEKSLLE